jgi:hypothetical protein
MQTTSSGTDGVREVTAEIWGTSQGDWYYNGVYPARKGSWQYAQYTTDDGGTYGGTIYYMIRIPDWPYTNNAFAPMTPQRTMYMNVGREVLPWYIAQNMGFNNGYAAVNYIATMWLYPVYRTKKSYQSGAPSASTWKKYCRFATQAEINTHAEQGTNPSKGGNGGNGGHGGLGGRGGRGGYWNGSKQAPESYEQGFWPTVLAGSATEGKSGATIRSGTQPSGWEVNGSAITTDATNLQHTKTWGTMTSGAGGAGSGGGPGGRGGSGGTGGELVLANNQTKLYNAAAPSAASNGAVGVTPGNGVHGGVGTNDSRFTSYSTTVDDYGETFQVAAVGPDGGSGGTGGDGGDAGATGSAVDAIGFLATDQAYTYTESTN